MRKLINLARSQPRCLAVGRRSFMMVHRGLRAVGYPDLLGPVFRDMRMIRGPLPLAAQDAPRVLFVAPRYWSTHVAFQTSLAQAVAIRGGQSAVVTCGGALPACEITWAERETVPPCAKCTAYVRDLADLAGLRHHSIAELAPSEAVGVSIDELRTLTL